MFYIVSNVTLHCYSCTHIYIYIFLYSMLICHFTSTWQRTICICMPHCSKKILKASRNSEKAGLSVGARAPSRKGYRCGALILEKHEGKKGRSQLVRCFITHNIFQVHLACFSSMFHQLFAPLFFNFWLMSHQKIKKSTAPNFSILNAPPSHPPTLPPSNARTAEEMGPTSESESWPISKTSVGEDDSVHPEPGSNRPKFASFCQEKLGKNQ